MFELLKLLNKFAPSRVLTYNYARFERDYGKPKNNASKNGNGSSCGSFASQPRSGDHH